MSAHSHQEDANGRYIRIPRLLEVDDSGDKIVISKRFE